jgi:hypothetical protein
MLQILEATQAAYGHLPVAALKLISQKTGAWYAMIYGTATYYGHLRMEPPSDAAQASAIADRLPTELTFLAGLDASLAGGSGTRQPGRRGGRTGGGRAQA